MTSPYWEKSTTNKRSTWFSTSLHTLLVSVESILVSTTATVPEAHAALVGSIVVPLENKFGTSTFFLWKLANVHSCKSSWEKNEKEQYSVKGWKHVQLKVMRYVLNYTLNMRFGDWWDQQFSMWDEICGHIGRQRFIVHFLAVSMWWQFTPKLISYWWLNLVI